MELIGQLVFFGLVAFLIAFIGYLIGQHEGFNDGWERALEARAELDSILEGRSK